MQKVMIERSSPFLLHLAIAGALKNIFFAKLFSQSCSNFRV